MPLSEVREAMTPAPDLAALEELAHIAQSPGLVFPVTWPMDVTPQQAAYIAAASPAAILALIARVRRLEEALRPLIKYAAPGGPSDADKVDAALAAAHRALNAQPPKEPPTE
jgi:hypothetical protein